MGIFIIKVYNSVTKFRAIVAQNQFLIKIMKIIKTDMYFNHSKSPHMHTNPKENRTRLDQILLEQFLCKGYKCEEIREEDATVFIITHEKKNSDVITQAMNDTYKDFLRAN